MHDLRLIPRWLSISVIATVAVMHLFFSTSASDHSRDYAAALALQTDEIAPVPRPIFVYDGSCGELGEIQWPLNDLTSPHGEDGGSTDSDRTEYSFTANVPLTIGQILGGNFAINVHESGEKSDMSLSCGNIGGVPDAVGTLVIGLRQQDDSGITGIAVLSPSPADPALTYVSVFIAGEALGEAIGTIGVTPIPVADENPPASQDPPVDDGGGGDDDDDGDD